MKHLFFVFLFLAILVACTEETPPEQQPAATSSGDFTAEPIPTPNNAPPTATLTRTSTPTKTAPPPTSTSTVRPSTPRLTNTPRSTNTPRPTNTLRPTVAPTNTPQLPTFTPQATWTLALPTNTATFTAVPVLTDTPFPSPVPTQELPTDTPPAPVGPPEGVPAICTCTGPDLDCGDFGTHNAATTTVSAWATAMCTHRRQ